MDETPHQPIVSGPPEPTFLAFGPPEPTQTVEPVEPLHPTAPAERLPTLDILRGFAIFGILTVNILAFSAPVLTGFIEPPAALVDRVVLALIRFFTEMKFYTLFSFLFGLGFAMQMERGAARGLDPMPLFQRRLLVLLGIGLIHTIFIWSGDILVTYAVLGLVLQLFRNAPPRQLLWGAGVGIAMATLVFGTLGMSGGGGSTAMGAEGGFDFSVSSIIEWYRTRAMQAYAHGGYWDMTLQRLIETGMIWAAGFSIAPHVLAMFLLGLWAGKRGVFRNVEGEAPLLRRVMIWGFVVGVVPNLIYAIGKWRGDYVEGHLWDDAAHVVSFFGATAFSMAYAAGLTLLASRPRGRRLLSPLAPVGRMALSNYLFQSIVCTTIFYNHGLGLFGRVGPAQALAIALGVFAVQVPLSAWWLSKFAFGPAEWLWRSLTYGSFQPMRRPA